jgi:hypothetical protein
MTREEQLARKGADRLNEQGPADWPFRITEPVDVFSLDNCPLAQVYRDDHRWSPFSEGLSRLNVEGTYSDYGFSDLDGMKGPATLRLNAAWEEIIVAERAARS